MENSSVRDAWGLDPEVVYLNHGSFGAAPRVVLAEQQRWRDRLEANPMRFMEEELGPAHLEVVGRLSEFVGADPEGLVPVPNATAGVNAALRSLEPELGPGDEILVTSHGYNACTNAAAVTAERTGARVVSTPVPFPPDGPGAVLDAVLEAVTIRTRVAILDHVTSPTALIFPIVELVGALEPDVAVIVDGAHASGMVPLDVDALGVSYYTSNCHKWLCAPKASGFLVTREDRRDRTVPTVISHAWNQPWGALSRYESLFAWMGTHDPSAWLSVPAALDALAEMAGDWDEVMAANHDLALSGGAVVADALGVAQEVPESMLGSMVTIPVPSAVQALEGTEPAPGIDPLTSHVRHAHGIEVPVVPNPAQAGERLLRISAQLYNTITDYERLAEALSGLR